MNRLALVLACVFIAACSRVEDPSLYPVFEEVSPTQPKVLPKTLHNPQKQVLFGDLHIHTSLSTDAYVMGVRSVPDDVYRFAKGQAIKHAAGYPLKIARPLDFAAVTDHAEYLGQARADKIDVPTSRRPLREILLEGSKLKTTIAWLQSTLAIRKNGFAVGLDEVDPNINRSAWQETIAAAERHNSPGEFTTFIGYEWSASVGEVSTHIHRCVIYRGSAVSDLPFSSLNSNRPEDLWAFLQQEEQQGREVFAIPHNANVSEGNMYASVDSDGNALTPAYAQLRNTYEPISEILQIKGSSEAHPLLSNLDEFADYGISLMVPGSKPELDQLKGSYTRSALRVGLENSHNEGFNPYQFGVIGSSDSHNADSPSDESSYTGKLPMMDGSAGLRTSEALLLPQSANPVTTWNSGGLAGVWAEQNTRASIFDALRRKETFATSGPRISVRLFVGWDFDASMLGNPDLIQRAYAGGVAMGGKLQPGGDGQTSPGFLLFALKDPLGANLDRLQVIKGWVDKNGVSHEKIFNVAASDKRAIDSASGVVEALASTVDLTNATYENSVGASEFAVYWQDPEFDAAQQAFYYLRVLEIPTPRWSTYDAVQLGVEPMQPSIIQERAISSAVWYSPTD